MEEHEILYIFLNPIISYQAKRSSLRQVKTYAIDAYQLCVLYYKEDFVPQFKSLSKKVISKRKRLTEIRPQRMRL
ncbi:hypothetical protein MPH47_20540 [Psychrobacillus psychrodurans]|nr:hypothetical protein [Psychrobacillus psychrodurans]MCK1999582.1 hypothetical protein [Psychrobacillus psychrodurans]